MSERVAIEVASILARGVITEADVATLRSAIYGGDGTISRNEALSLLQLNCACHQSAETWGAFFVEALAGHVVDTMQPEGYVTAENATWLIGCLGAGTRPFAPEEIELVITVLEKARWSPASLVACALHQVKQTVLSGTGPSRGADGGSPFEAPMITDEEVKLLRRVLYAFGGDGGVAITRVEAECLFDINDAISQLQAVPARPNATPPSPNAAFTDLFCKAIANCVMAASGYRVPLRADALAAQAWLDRRGDLSPAAILASIVHTGLGGIWHAYRDQTAEERALGRLERQRIEIITNEEITEGEATWLAGRIGRDGRLTSNEAALIAYFKATGTRLHPILSASVERLAKAA